MAKKKEKLEAEQSVIELEAAQNEIRAKAGFWNDVVTVKAAVKHPTIEPGTEYRVHSAHIPYLTHRGYIESVQPDVKQ